MLQFGRGGHRPPLSRARPPDQTHKECRVILVTRFNGSQFYVNAELIQTVEGTPDTVITLTTGVQLIVREPPPIILERIITYHRQIHVAPRPTSGEG
jgi:flagellar protein FlbD